MKKEKNILANIDAEKELLSAIIFDNNYFSSIHNLLRNSKCFYDLKHRIIYDCMIKLHDAGVHIDTISLYENLKDNEDITVTYLASFNIPYSNIDYTARVVYKYWLYRQVIEVSKEAIKLSLSGKEDEFELLEKVIERFENINHQLEFQREEINFVDRIPQIYDSIGKERNDPSKKAWKVQTFPSFNIATGGIKPGNLVVISGDYKKGKSTFGLSLLIDFCVNAKLPAGFLSLEMSQEEIDRKIISLVTGTRYGYLRDPGAKSKGEFILSDEMIRNSISIARKELTSTKFYCSDEMLDQSSITAKVKYWVRKHNLKIILVDYIGLIETSEKFERRDLEIAYLSRFFKLLAKRLDVCFIILSQENAEGKVAESKALSRDADFWFSITHPIDDVKKNKLDLTQKLIMNGKEVTIKLDESLFLVELKASRHGVNGTRMLCQFHRNGMFNEIDPEAQHSNQEYKFLEEENE